MNSRRLKILLFCCVCWCITSHAQDDLLEIAEAYYENGKYSDALSTFNRSFENETNKKIMYKKAICYYHIDQIENAKEIFLDLKDKSYDEPELYNYLAQTYQAKGDYKNAIQAYKYYLKEIKRDHPNRRMIVDKIKRCANGNKVQYYPQLAFVENFGAAINTSYNDFGVVQSPNYLNRFYFSSSREESTGGLRDKNGLKDDIYGSYYSDIYAVESNAGIWKLVDVLNPLVNSPKHDIIQGFSEDGSQMYYIKGIATGDSKLYLHTFNNDDNTLVLPTEFESNVVGGLGDRNIQVYNDSTFVYSSKRITGEGGYDIFVMRKRGDVWLEPKNISRVINSDYDEICPFLSRDGRKIYFSSNRLESMGGYDIFYSEFDSKTKMWSEPIHAGLPVNSTRDDTHFRLSHDGTKAIFSSDRLGGYGGKDLYIAYLKNQEKRMLLGQSRLSYLFPKGTLNDDPSYEIEADDPFAVEEEVVKEDVRKKYIISPLSYTDDKDVISPQNIQKLNILVDLLSIYPTLRLELVGNTSDEGITPYELYFTLKRAEKVANYLIDRDVNIDKLSLKGVGNNYPKVKNILSGGSVNLAEKINKRIEIIVHNDMDEPIDIRYEEPTIADYLQDDSYQLYSNSISEISYKVQVVQVSQLYTNDVLSQYPDAMIEKDLYSDQFYYTVGLYDNYMQAKRLKDQLIQNNFRQSMVIPYLNGKRLEYIDVVNQSANFPDLEVYLKYE